LSYRAAHLPFLRLHSTESPVTLFLVTDATKNRDLGIVVLTLW